MQIQGPSDAFALDAHGNKRVKPSTTGAATEGGSPTAPSFAALLNDARIAQGADGSSTPSLKASS